VIVFFAARRVAGGTEYSLRAVATVANKVSQVDIWERPDLSPFRDYLNLLIRPATHGRFEWHEEAADHPDWLWRVCEPRGLSKGQVVEASRRGSFDPGRPIDCGANYVIFDRSRNRTVVLESPLCIATALATGATETWHPDHDSQSVKALTLDQSSSADNSKRGLRTRNRYVPHRHLRLDRVTDVAVWRSALLAEIGH
jgi:hypothetical protein